MWGTVLVVLSVSRVVLLINSYGLGKGCHNHNLEKMNKYGFFHTLFLSRFATPLANLGPYLDFMPMMTPILHVSSQVGSESWLLLLFEPLLLTVSVEVNLQTGVQRIAVI